MVQRGKAIGVTVALLLALASVASADHNLAELASDGPHANVGVELLDTTDGARPVVGVSDDGAHLFYSVDDPVCPQDQERYYDYSASAGTISPVTVSEAGQQVCIFGPIVFNAADGTHAVFQTNAKLVPEDTDTQDDVYERVGGHTRLASTSATDTGTGAWSIPRISADGSAVFFYGNDPLVPEDTDTVGDLYERSGGTTKLVTLKSDGTNQSTGFVNFLRATPDGSAVFFTTDAVYDPADTNVFIDIYKRAGGNTTLVSDWPHGGGIQMPQLAAVSPDASRVIVRTASQLVPAEDTDSEFDLYELSGGDPILLSKGPAPGPQASRVFFEDATADATTVWFATDDPLTSDDLDSTSDIYKRSGGTTTLISTGPSSSAPAQHLLAGFSADAARSIFSSTEQLVPQDTDSRSDIYERSGGVTTLLSTGPSGGNGDFPASEPQVSADGGRVFFLTEEALVPADTDTTLDLYERHPGGLTLISSAPGAGSTPTNFSDYGISEDGTVAYFESQDNVGSDTDGLTDIYAARVTPPAPYPRPKAATPVNVALVPVYSPCASPNRVHAPPLSFSSCSPPVRPSTELTLGTPDANGQAAKSVNYTRIVVQPGNPSTPANETDLFVELHAKDVRRASDLDDYTGQLAASLSVRATGRSGTNAAGNGPASATTEVFPLNFAVGCAGTTDTTVGSDCDVVTSANTLVPGALVERDRTIWELGAVQVSDGGPDGVASTVSGNQPFLGQGIFIP